MELSILIKVWVLGPIFSTMPVGIMSNVNAQQTGKTKQSKESYINNKLIVKNCH